MSIDVGTPRERIEEVKYEVSVEEVKKNKEEEKRKKNRARTALKNRRRNAYLTPKSSGEVGLQVALELQMQKAVEEAELRVQQSLPMHVPLPNTSSHDKTIGSSNSSNYSNLPSYEPKKRKGMSGPLEKVFNISAREKLDGYVPPGCNSLRTTLLQKEKSNIERLLVPIKENVVHVITDNAPVCKAAGLLVELTTPIYEMLRMTDTDTPCLQLVYEWWDSMIEKVKIAIFRKERRQLDDKSRYYSQEWLEEAPDRVAPHKDLEIAVEKNNSIERYFTNDIKRRKVNEGYAAFTSCLGHFSGHNSISDSVFMSPVNWWIVHGTSTPSLQSIALKLLQQPCSSSCCERNWSTYNFIHSLRRNKMTPQRAEDLVFVHNNLRLLSRKSPSYNEGVS
ncbi:hypothetical protein Ddye_009797 [Dipteronia dyeriana]|uniref:HAT C-terminal dimerisation domain-containing protein n=1 Tax=Dipteronia dyeriana TaxID=168575 RepID=A0AAD9XC26_9ROSI|nr:hypothetical protein Ddye_009797 [Dipteronia dyeriana]